MSLIAVRIRRRPKCPAAPAPVVRTGLVCHCGTLNHAVSDADRAAVEVELAAAREAGKLYLVDSLMVRLQVCPNPGPSGVAL